MDRDEHDRFAAKTLILTLCGAKLVVIGIVVVITRDTEGLTYALISTWYWLIPLTLVVGGPLLFRYRLHRARAQLKRLLEEEWSWNTKQPAPEVQTAKR